MIKKEWWKSSLDFSTRNHKIIHGKPNEISKHTEIKFVIRPEKLFDH